MIWVGATAFLFWVRKGLKPLLTGFGLRARTADVMAKAGPVAAVALTTLITWALGLESAGVQTVGDVPRGLPPLTVPGFDPELWLSLAGAAVLISVIGFVDRSRSPQRSPPSAGSGSIPTRSWSGSERPTSPPD